MKEAVIVSTARTGMGKSFRGALNDTEAPAMGGHAVKAAVERAGIDPASVEDVIMGAAAQQGTQSYNAGTPVQRGSGPARHDGGHDHGPPVQLWPDVDCLGREIHYV